MKYALAVGTARGEVLVFPCYGETEYHTVMAIASEQSRHVPWTEIRETATGKVSCRYRRGLPERGQDPQVWRQYRESRTRHYSPLQEWPRPASRPARVPGQWDDDED